MSAPGACRTALDGLRQRVQLLRGVYSRLNLSLKHHRCLCVRTGNREGTRAPHAALHWSRVITAKSLGALCRRDPERERLKTHKLFTRTPATPLINRHWLPAVTTFLRRLRV